LTRSCVSIRLVGTGLVATVVSVKPPCVVLIRRQALVQTQPNKLR